MSSYICERHGKLMMTQACPECVKALVEALQGLCHDDGCFCETAFAMSDGSHPRHSDECTKACAALAPFEEARDDN